MGLLTKYFNTPPKVTQLKNIFSEDDCREIIKDFEVNKEKIKKSNDHGVVDISSYEIDIKDFSENIRELIEYKIKGIVLPFTGGEKGMIFGIRYCNETMNYMEPHYDCNTYSCVITLNDNFVGGGTNFPLYGKIYKTKVGDGIIFEADKINSYHSGHPVTKGVRYVLVLRTDKRPTFLQILDSLFLHFVDRYINKRKDKLYKNPTTNYLR